MLEISKFYVPPLSISVYKIPFPAGGSRLLSVIKYVHKEI